MKTLSSNSELYEYLLALEANLRARGSTDLANAVAGAGRQASAISTEFLGESRIALRRVSSLGRITLTGQERADLDDVLKQLDAALDRR
jgi:hypothetical protein